MVATPPVSESVSRYNGNSAADGIEVAERSSVILSVSKYVKVSGVIVSRVKSSVLVKYERLCVVVNSDSAL